MGLRGRTRRLRAGARTLGDHVHGVRPGRPGRVPRHDRGLQERRAPRNRPSARGQERGSAAAARRRQVDPVPPAEDRVRSPSAGEILPVAVARTSINWSAPEQVLQPREGAWWDSLRIGIGPPPLRTEHGWLLIYHGVKETSPAASTGSASHSLDLDEPTRVLHRLPEWIFGPLRAYEREGDVPNVVFPCGLVHDAATDELRLYYGAADTSICLATARLGDLLAAVRWPRPRQPVPHSTVERAALLRGGALLGPALLQRLLGRFLATPSSASADPSWRRLCRRRHDGRA